MNLTTQSLAVVEQQENFMPGPIAKSLTARLIRTVGLAGLAFAVLAGETAQAQQADPAGQQAAMATADFGQARRCGDWLSLLDMEALRLAAEETLAIARSRGLPIPNSPPAKACSDAVERARLTAAAQGFSNTLLLRAQALAAMTDPVGFQLATTHEQKASLDVAASRLKAAAWAAGRGAVFDQLAAKQRQEAEAIANLACAARRTVRSPKARPCPALPPAAETNVPAAMAMLTSAEVFSQRLATEMAAAAPPPMNRLWQYDMAMSIMQTLGAPGDQPSTTCTANQPLLHLADARAVRASNEHGEVLYVPTIRPDGQSAPVWRVIVMLKSDERLLMGIPSGTGPTSLLRAARVVQLPDWDETRIRDTEGDAAIRDRWVDAAVRAAVADIIAGEQVSIYRRCT